MLQQIDINQQRQFNYNGTIHLLEISNQKHIFV